MGTVCNRTRKGYWLTFTLVTIVLGSYLIYQHYGPSYRPSDRLAAPPIKPVVYIPTCLLRGHVCLDSNGKVVNYDKRFRQTGITTETPSAEFQLEEICRKAPDAVLIGFEKCGTMTLKHFLSVNKNIYVPFEPNLQYFNKKRNISFAELSTGHSCTPKDKLRFEKLSISAIPSRVYRHNKNMKLIAIVRDPVTRSMSSFMQLKRGRAPDGSARFKQDIQNLLSRRRIPAHPPLIHGGMYISKLKKYLQFFSKDQIHIVDGDNFSKNPAYELQRVEKFLGVRPQISMDDFIYNERKKFYCIRGDKQDLCMDERKGRTHAHMDEETKQLLAEFYAPYNAEFFRMFGKEYNWTKPL